MIFQNPKDDPRKAVIVLIIAFFIIFGLLAWIPIIHFILINSIEEAIKIFQFYEIVKAASFYITGAVIYALLIPERLFPGKINIIVFFVNFSFRVIRSFIFVQYMDRICI